MSLDQVNQNFLAFRIHLKHEDIYQNHQMKRLQADASYRTSANL